MKNLPEPNDRSHRSVFETVGACLCARLRRLTVMSSKMSFICSVVVLLFVAVTAVAQSGDTGDDSSTMTPEELRKAYERLPKERYYRHGSHLYDQTIKFSQADQKQMNLKDQFLQAYYEDRWGEVRRVLRLLPDDLARETYDKILSDLNDRHTPILSLDDFIGLCDACPTTLDSTRIRRLGLLLRVAVAPEQEPWLQRRLEQGTRFLGLGADKRITTGRMLIHAEFDDLAREYVPGPVAATQIEDGSARHEISNFWKSQQQLEEFQESKIAGLWKDRARVLSNPSADQDEQRRAAERLAELFSRAPIPALEPWVDQLLKDRPQGALQLASVFGKQAQDRINSRDVDIRGNHLQAQRMFLRLAAHRTDLSRPPWRTVATAMADWWIQEAEHTFENAPSYREVDRSKPHVPPAELLDTVPEGEWRSALAPAEQERIDVCLSKAVLVSDRYEEAVPLIAELAKGNAEAGVRLAEEYLKAWADRHDPHVPEDVRKELKLPDEARIVVTPLMMEKNIDDLAKMMGIFRRRGIHPRNGDVLVDAFDICYSNAEVYRMGHIEKVFGSINAMNEEILYQILLRMTEGLGSRWRSLEVQEEAGTRRTEAETLEMVRQGYQTALDIIEERVAARPDSWRLLTLAGSLLAGWGDFEYYQRLVDDAGSDRVEHYQQKNNQAAEYFRRGATVYANQLAELGPANYSIEPYLAWFHALLGIGVNGQMNVAKPLDRPGLNEIRELVRGLPKNAAKVHVDRFAKHVAARLEDVENPLHEDLKYKYLAGSLVITRKSPFSFQASDKVTYYDELLDEIHLETRVDGSNTIHRQHDFGVLLIVRHTEAMGRMADFGKYLVNDLVAQNAPGRQNKPRQPATVYRMSEIQGRRDELEQNITEALSLFLDIRSIVFSPRDVQPRATDKPGWQETVLAYIQCRAKDASVDKIPRIQMDLEFLDLTGPVTITAESPETMIKVTEQPTPPRPFGDLDLNVVVDDRNLEATEEIILEVEATANGLVPELGDITDLRALEQQLPIARIEPHEGVRVQRVNSWAESVHAVSERRWTVALDAGTLVEPPRRIELRPLGPTVENTSVAFQAYEDMDLVQVDKPTVIVGLGSGPVHTDEMKAESPVWSYLAIGGGLFLVAVLLVLAFVAMWKRERPVRARDVFHVPESVDGFTVVNLLRALDASPLVRMNSTRRAELREEISRIEKSCFNNAEQSIPETQLRDLARQWLRIAC